MPIDTGESTLHVSAGEAPTTGTDGEAGIGFRNAKRIQESFTASFERQALEWLAFRLPAWVNSDHLTLLGFIAMFLAGVSYAFARVNRAGFLFATSFW
jgi:hypothetical protein